MFAQPVQIGAQSIDESGKAASKARVGSPLFFVEKDIIQVLEPGRYANVSEIAAHDRNDAFPYANSLFNFPGADWRIRGRGRQYEDDCICLPDKALKT